MEWIELGDLVDIRKGTKLQEIDYSINSIRMIMIDDLRSNENIKYTVKNEKNVYAEKDDIIIAWDGANAGIVGFNLEGALGSTLARLRLKNNKINSLYLGLFLQSKFQEIRDHCTGATIPHVNRNHLTKIKIPVPPIEIQNQIVEVLDEAQKLIDNRKKQIELLNDLIESIFYDMFGDPVKNDKGWEVKRLGDSSEIITGNTPPRKDTSNYGNHIEWIKSDNINTPHTYLTKAEEYLSEEGKAIGRYVDAGSILMTCIAGSIGCIGNVAIADREVAFNQQINAIIPKRYNLFFLYILFKLSKEYIQNNSTSSMKGMISKGNLSNLEFVIPPLPLQNKFAEKVELIEKQKALMEQSLKLMEDNYNSLMQRAFKGELF